jgi:hypothetical protein
MRHLLLLLFVALSACGALAVFLGLFLMGVLLLVASLVFLAVLVACLLYPFFMHLF